MRTVSSVVFTVLVAAIFVAMPVVAQDAMPKVIKGGILNGKAVSLPKPEYPADAKAAGVEGPVYVDVEIDENGMVASAAANSEPRKVKRTVNGEVIETELPAADPRLRDAAEQAARQARFSPTLLSGQPVRVQGTIVYNFVALESESVTVKSSEADVLNGQATSLPKAGYPAAARAVRAQGVVNVQVTVSESGDVVSASAISGHPLLRAAAVAAAQAAKFNPQSAKAVGILTYNFVLPKEDPN